MTEVVGPKKAVPITAFFRHEEVEPEKRVAITQLFGHKKVYPCAWPEYSNFENSAYFPLCS
jgi:hypothetical protein